MDDELLQTYKRLTIDWERIHQIRSALFPGLDPGVVDPLRSLLGRHGVEALVVTNRDVAVFIIPIDCPEMIVGLLLAMKHRSVDRVAVIFDHIVALESDRNGLPASRQPTPDPHQGPGDGAPPSELGPA